MKAGKKRPDVCCYCGREISGDVAYAVYDDDVIAHVECAEREDPDGERDDEPDDRVEAAFKRELEQPVTEATFRESEPTDAAQ